MSTGHRFDARRMEGKVALVTGAASGIGRETALACAGRGARVAVCDVTRLRLDEVATDLRELGVEVVAERVDVSDPDEMESFAETVHSEFGPVDLLINNAGVGLVGGFLDTTLDDWDRLVGINLMGVVHGCHSFLPEMIATGGGGHVVNVASAAGFLANPALCAYTATKFAVLGLSEALRAELRPHGIGVTAICPGVINTPITATSPIRGEDSEQRRERMAGIYERRGYSPERVAERILSAVQRDRAVAPVAPEAHAMYAVSRAAPPVGRWLAGRMAELAK
jgi:NAD(P)-dependent dehydrogenase (short-subunit alcohol dehydrogenase family)